MGVQDLLSSKAGNNKINVPDTNTQKSSIGEVGASSSQLVKTQSFLYSSYSGADIRLLIHSSHPEVMTMKTNELNNQIDEIDARIKTINKISRQADSIQDLSEHRIQIQAVLLDIQVGIDEIALEISEGDLTAEEGAAALEPLFEQQLDEQKTLKGLEDKIREANKNLEQHNVVGDIYGEKKSLETAKKDLQDGVKSIKKAGRATIPLATVQTLSVQVFREKFAVRSLGSNSPKSFTRGPRTVAGSMVFTVFDEHALAPFLHHPPTSFAHEKRRSSAVGFVDQLPPMTISIEFANEYGSVSEMTIYGVEFVDDGQVISIEDIFTENTCSYVARDFDPMMLRRVDRSKWPGQADGEQVRSASSLLQDPKNNYRDYLQRLNIKRDPYR